MKTVNSGIERCLCSSCAFVIKRLSCACVENNQEIKGLLGISLTLSRIIVQHSRKHLI